MTTPGTAKGPGGKMGNKSFPKNPKNSKVAPGPRGKAETPPTGKYKLPK